MSLNAIDKALENKKSRKLQFFYWDEIIRLDLYISAIRVVEFSNRAYKIRKIFAQESTYSKEITEFWELG